MTQLNAGEYPNYYSNVEYQRMPSVSNPLDKVAMQTLTDVNVLNAVAIPGFEMELVEGARAAGQVAGEVAEGFWSSLWTGIKSAGKFMGEVAEGVPTTNPVEANGI